MNSDCLNSNLVVVKARVTYSNISDYSIKKNIYITNRLYIWLQGTPHGNIITEAYMRSRTKVTDMEVFAFSKLFLLLLVLLDKVNSFQIDLFQKTGKAHTVEKCLKWTF